MPQANHEPQLLDVQHARSLPSQKTLITQNDHALSGTLYNVTSFQSIGHSWTATFESESLIVK